MNSAVADDEFLIVLIEPASTKHTGDVISEKLETFKSKWDRFRTIQMFALSAELSTDDRLNRQAL